MSLQLPVLWICAALAQPVAEAPPDPTLAPAAPAAAPVAPAPVLPLHAVAGDPGAVCVPEPSGKSKSAAAPAVLRLRRVGNTGPDPLPEEPTVVHLGEEVELLLRSCETAEALRLAAADRGSPLTLYIDGRPILGLSGQVILSGTPRLRFRLHRNAQNDGAVSALLGTALQGSRMLPVTAGLADGSQLLSSQASLRIERLGLGEKALFVGIFVLVLAAAAGTRGSDLLRDRGRVPAGGVASWSLARVQMAYWTTHITLAFLFVYFVAGQVPELPGSLIVLMGLGSGTLVAAAAIEETAGPQRDQAPASTGSFWRDLVNDGRDAERGVSLHRLQLVAWTLIVGLLFWVSVLTEFRLPVLDETLLGLMGISAATYLGMKIPEEGASTPSLPAPPPPAAPAPAPPGAEDPAAGDDPAPDAEEDPPAPAPELGLEDLMRPDSARGGRMASPRPDEG